MLIIVKAERAEWARRIERADLLAREKEYQNRYTDNTYFNRRPEPSYYSENRAERQLHNNPPPPVETICLDDDDANEGDTRRDETRYHSREEDSVGMRDHSSANGDRIREHSSASNDRYGSARSDTGARSAIEVDTHVPDEPQDEGEDFTIDELKSLLENFEYLSRSEQVWLNINSFYNLFLLLRIKDLIFTKFNQEIIFIYRFYIKNFSLLVICIISKNIFFNLNNFVSLL